MRQSASPTAVVAPRADGVSLERRNSRLSALGWGADPELAYPDWVTEGRRIGQLWRASPWWIGDWLLFGTTRWGEMYAQAARITGYDRKSLRNMRYVSSRIELSLRKDNLTWSHHALLASLESEEQRHWLDRAIRERFSVEDLRVELRDAKRAAQPEHVADGTGSPLDAPEHRATVLCPSCGEPVPIPLGGES